ncbi:hypothetical protein CAT24_09095 [Acinetobacter pittii]|nr:hypothetical protein CAT24_09095 [Acinetobacter pittii]
MGILSIICLWVGFPFIFKLLIEAYKLPDDFKDFGPFGDIYGSLNTLISSIALCAVAFSTWLQVTSLKETREATASQLAEAKNVALSNQFYSLMTFKNEMLYQMKFQAKNNETQAKEHGKWTRDVNAMEALSLIANKFKKTIHSREKYSKPAIRLNHFENLMKNLFEEEVSQLISYFYIYGDLIRLINNADVDEKIKENLKSVLRNTMLQEEQIVLFWFASIFEELNNSLENSGLFNKFHYGFYRDFALKFHKESHFKSDSWKKVFDENGLGNPT